MNPYRIYREEWARALSLQATAAEYATFVALPFADRFSYRSADVLDKVLTKAAEHANGLGIAKRRFANPKRVNAPGATVITEEIALKILESHFFVADLTFANHGVLVEAGIALGTKPAEQIILITQGQFEELHFDFRNNAVIQYNAGSSIHEIADRLIGCANYFEEQVGNYIRNVTRRLSSDAILCLNWYGQIQRDHGKFASLHSEARGPYFEGADGLVRFGLATQELREKDLLWTHYSVGAIPNGDAYGMHATEMGWIVIESMWQALRRPREQTLVTSEL